MFDTKKAKHIAILLARYDIEIELKDAHRFIRFAKLRFTDLQNMGIYLTDIELGSLIPKIRRIFYAETFEMWKKYESER